MTDDRVPTERTIDDCPCAHCAVHRATDAALDEHFVELERNPPDPAVQAANRERLREAAKFFRGPTPAISPTERTIDNKDFDTRDPLVPKTPLSTERTIQDRCAEAANNKALSIGEAWNLLDDAASRIDALESALKDALRAGRGDGAQGLKRQRDHLAAKLSAAEAAKDAAYEEVAAENTRANEAEARIAELDSELFGYRQMAARYEESDDLHAELRFAEARLEAQGKVAREAVRAMDAHLHYAYACWNLERRPNHALEGELKAKSDAARAAIDSLEAK